MNQSLSQHICTNWKSLIMAASGLLLFVVFGSISRAAGQAEGPASDAQQGRFFVRDFRPTARPRVVQVAGDNETRRLLARSRNRELLNMAWVAESASGEKAAAVPVRDETGRILHRSADGETLTAQWDIITRDRVVFADVSADAATMDIAKFTLRDSGTGEGLEFNPKEGRVYKLAPSTLQSAASGTVACILNDLGTLAQPCEAGILVANMAACIAGIAALPETAGLSAVFALPACGTVLSTLEQSLLCAGTDCGLQATMNPTVVQTVVLTQAQGTSIQLQNCQAVAENPCHFLYGYVTGGAAASSPFANGQLAQVTDADGQIAAATAHGSSNSNSYSTNTSYHTGVGVAIGGVWNQLTAVSAANSTAGATGVEQQFNITETSLVVVMGFASSQQQLQLGGLPGLQVDATTAGVSGEEPLVVAHATLSAGTYTATLVSSIGNLQGQRTMNESDLIVVYIFGY